MTTLWVDVKRRFLIKAVMGVWCLACWSVAVSCTATSHELIHTFRAENPARGDYFGTAVALEDGVAVIKSHSGYLDGDGLSVTHIFEESTSVGWQESATFEFDNGDTRGNPFNGHEIAIDGGEVVIGYSTIFDRPTRSPLRFAKKQGNQWIATFNTPTPIQNVRDFAIDTTRVTGRVVDISGEFAIAEATNARRPDQGVGAARIYQRGNGGDWQETANLIPVSGDSITISAVAIDGDNAAMIHRDFGGGGELYFFEKQQSGDWNQTASFSRDNGRPIDNPNIHISGDSAVTRDETTGQIVIYQRDDTGWKRSPSIFSTDPSLRSSHFSGVAIDDGIIAYTDYLVQDNTRFLFPAVILLRETSPGIWNEFDTIFEPGFASLGDFGSSLSLDGNRLLVGASTVRFGMSGRHPGAAYLFAIVPEPSSVALLLTALFSVTVPRMGIGRR